MNKSRYRSYRTLRDGFLIGPVPGNKLPGYDHWSLRDGGSFSRGQTLPPFTYEHSGETRVTSGKIYIGTSGWVYKDWASRFFPKEVPKKTVPRVLRYPIPDRRNQCDVLPVTGRESV